MGLRVDKIPNPCYNNNVKKGKVKIMSRHEYTKGNYVYSGNKEYGSPVREVRVVSQKEADYWDRLEKEIKRQERYK